jgi:hypothetical protein
MSISAPRCPFSVAIGRTAKCCYCTKVQYRASQSGIMIANDDANNLSIIQRFADEDPARIVEQAIKDSF